MYLVSVILTTFICLNKLELKFAGMVYTCRWYFTKIPLLVLVEQAVLAPELIHVFSLADFKNLL